MYLSVHILCMNDCTLPIHLNSILHITSTLIWAIKCAVCFIFFFDYHRQVCQLIHKHRPCCYNDKNRFCCWKKNVPKKWSAFYDDCNRWKCFTTHFHSCVVINKTALNCICYCFQLLLKIISFLISRALAFDYGFSFSSWYKDVSLTTDSEVYSWSRTGTFSLERRAAVYFLKCHFSVTSAKVQCKYLIKALMNCLYVSSPGHSS